MFILNRQQVKFCQVVSSQAGNAQVSPAIAFNGSLFTKGETFLSSEKTKACKRVQELLEVPQQLVLLLEDKAELALYHLNSQVSILETQEVTSNHKVEQIDRSKESESDKGMLHQLRHKLNNRFNFK